MKLKQMMLIAVGILLCSAYHHFEGNFERSAVCYGVAIGFACGGVIRKPS